jgi:hypothetical protein
MARYKQQEDKKTKGIVYAIIGAILFIIFAVLYTIYGPSR